MEIFMMTTTRPWMPLTLACAPSASSFVPVAKLERAPISAVAPVSVAVLAAERAPVQRVHQVSVQAELGDLARTGINSTNSTNGTTPGFKGSNVSIKRYTDGGSGVPPRGRPV
ncbi:hypothetical protein [Actinoplanes solisilvae]|uniref:hypothetical protein n=1 Tax=Actinoplanes solisilvae TaxID=2486853 RepID=UPI000FD8E39F|nr:hypothetical protein [Actinoplanes solisilvae]